MLAFAFNLLAVGLFFSSLIVSVGLWRGARSLSRSAIRISYAALFLVYGLAGADLGLHLLYGPYWMIWKAARPNSTVSLARKACDHGNAQACFSLANLYKLAEESETTGSAEDDSLPAVFGNYKLKSPSPQGVDVTRGDPFISGYAPVISARFNTPTSKGIAKIKTTQNGVSFEIVSDEALQFSQFEIIFPIVDP